MSICQGSVLTVRWDAEGSLFILRRVGKISPPRSDHPASISLGIGMARLQEYVSSLVIIIYFAVPSISWAHFLDTAIVSGKGMLAGYCPGLVAAPFNFSPHAIVNVYCRQN